ncbi:MAG: transcription-repair coupling factor, partial [Bacteroidia bacterium]|nr:transcription-repair coupling factor [Bacteroidia bacterium]
DIGYETYQKILDEAIQELKESEFKDVFKEEMEKKKNFVRDVEIDSDIEMHIPTEYVSNIQERLNLYTELNNIKTLEKLEEFKKKMEDRFGPIPKAVSSLFMMLQINWKCRTLGFERLIYKNKKLRCYFITNPQSPFYETDLFQKFMQFIATKGVGFGLSMKKSNRHLILVKDNLKSLKAVYASLKFLEEELVEEPVSAI